VQEIQAISILNDVSFWVSVVIMLVASYGVFIIRSLKKSIENHRQDISKLFDIIRDHLDNYHNP